MDLSHYTVPLDTPISALDAEEAFNALTDDEKYYCHFLSRGSWEGAPICLFQTSPESVPLFLLLRQLFSRQSVASLKTAVGNSLSDDEFKAFLLYSSSVFSNMGNYKSFGDTKIIPSISKARDCVVIHSSESVKQLPVFDDMFKTVLNSSEFQRSQPELMERLWTACADAVYSLEQRERQLGLGEEGITTYFSKNCTKVDAEFIQGFMQEKDISSYNTRLFKTVGSDGNVVYEIRLASALTSAEPCDNKDHVASLLGTYNYQSTTVKVTRGDYAPLMQRMVDNLEKAKGYASNAHEKAMLESYIKSFMTGSVDDHKEGSRHWIRDKGPVVETYIGFIETYRDPFGVRAEFEGFVAIVNKTMSAKFAQLVKSAESFLPELPWPKEFEKDKFLRPDFTSLDIVTFASSGVPAGINIPNYDDIRQNEGFKNVSLGNVLSAAYSDKRVSFLSLEEQELFVSLRGEAFEVQVGLHELLGHGSGKLFQQEEDGTFNFDIVTVKNPVTAEKITSWYKPGETWDNKFRSLASSYEECRAECVGLYLCLNKDVLSIFGHVDEAADNILYINWLNMVRAGLIGLEYYTPETKKWRQAHMQARYVILRVLLEGASGLVSIEQTTGSDGKPDLVIKLDRSKIETIGMKAIGDFLNKLQVFKSVAAVASGEALYNKYSEVSEENGGWLSLRDIVMSRKMSRRMLVQPLTVIQDGKVSLMKFEPTPEGIIQSFTHFSKDQDYDQELETLWESDRHFWN